MSTGVSVTTDDSHVRLRSPYHPSLPARAKRLGGRFDGSTKSWHFDARDEQRVRDLAIAIYGTDGPPAETVTLRLTAHDEDEGSSVWVCGREVLTRRSRDERVRLGDGVVILAGAFHTSSGSLQYPAIGSVRGVVLEMRDVPAAAGRETTLAGWTIEVVEESAVDREALGAERTRLEERLAEIDRLLADGA